MEAPSGPDLCIWCTSSTHITPLNSLLPGSEAAMEAAGSLALIYPKVFSGRMVPRLEEELQSGRAWEGSNVFWGETCPILVWLLPGSGAVPYGIGWWLFLGDSQRRDCGAWC